MNKINLIPCVLWIKRGVAREIPNKLELTKDDLKRLIQESKQNFTSEEFVLIYIYFNIYCILFLIIVLFVICYYLNHRNDEEMNEWSEEESDDTNDGKSDDTNDGKSDDIISKYNLDNYDDDNDGEVGHSSLVNLANLTVFATNDDDPYFQNDDNEDVSHINN
jgi:periodic tryptophan protein 1